MQDRSLPRPGRGQALLKIRRAAICGTDLHIYNWNGWAEQNYQPPVVMGHEFCGEVIETGEDAGHIVPGAMVSGETHIYCNTCDQCRANRRHTCLNLRLFSKSGYGCFSDYSVVPVNALRLVPDQLSVDQGAVLEPLGIGVRAASEADVAGKTVLVVGCGPIGLYAIAAAKALGAATVLAIDLSRQRLDIAARVGADVCSSELSEVPPSSVDVTIDASGSAEVIALALPKIVPGGTMLMVGLPSKPISFAPSQVINREISIRGIYGRLIDETWLLTERLLKSDRLNVAAIQAAAYPITEFDTAFELAASGTVGKVMFNLD